MSETLSVRLPSLADITTLKLYLHDINTGALLNTGGDDLGHISNGLFQAMLDEDRSGSGNLYAVVCDGAETPANVVWDGWLQSEQTQIVSEYPAYNEALAAVDNNSSLTYEYLTTTLDPKINEMKEDTDLIPSINAVLASVDNNSSLTYEYLTTILDPKINEMKEDTDLIPSIDSGGDPAEVALAVLLLDWTTIVSSVPARSALNALRHIRNRWEIQGQSKIVYTEDNMTPAFTTMVTGGPDGEIIADYPNT